MRSSARFYQGPLPIITAIIRMELSESRMAKSASVRTRFTPTFYHHDIFGTSSPKDQQVRATPTFTSTVFNCDGYLVQTHHSRTLRVKEHPQDIHESHVYINESRQRKQAFLNPCSDYFPDYRGHCGDEKDRLAGDINHLQGRTSRLRKCVEQMSNPIFGGCSWTPFIPTAPHPAVTHQTYDSNQYRREKQAFPEVIPPQREDVQPQLHLPSTQQRQPQQAAIPKPSLPNSKAKATSKSTSKHSNNLKKFKSAANLRRA